MMKDASRRAARPYFDPRDLPQVLGDIEAVLRSGRLLGGPETEALEREFAARVGTRYAVAVPSCRAGLALLLRALHAAGRPVIVPANTCPPTAEAVLTAGGQVVLSECHGDGNFNVADALHRLTPDTAAVIVVHWAGFVPRDLLRLLIECRRLGVAVLEDCAHAHGARLHEQEVGSLGDAGCFSLAATKIATCGTGGMVTTDRADLAEAVRTLREGPIDEVRAVLARQQLRRLGELLAHRRAVAHAYEQALEAAGDRRIVPPRAAAGTSPAYLKFPVYLGAPLEVRTVQRRMAARGIETGLLYWPPLHRSPAFSALGVEMPLTDAVVTRRLCLPMHALVEPADCAEIVGALRESLDERSTAASAQELSP